MTSVQMHAAPQKICQQPGLVLVDTLKASGPGLAPLRSAPCTPIRPPLLSQTLAAASVMAVPDAHARTCARPALAALDCTAAAALLLLQVPLLHCARRCCIVNTEG
jgi:hypothetical protein